jgi:hypothetical protein
LAAVALLALSWNPQSVDADDEEPTVILSALEVLVA